MLTCSGRSSRWCGLGGIAVVNYGTPWFQDTDWSLALRGIMELWLDTKVTYRCGTDEDSQRRYTEDFVSDIRCARTAVDTTPT